MNRKQLWILIITTNVCFGSAVDYRFAKKLLKAETACTINVNGDLGDPQPLLIKPGTSAFMYPENSAGIIPMEINQEIEIYCTSGFSVPLGASSYTAKCIGDNQFEVNSISYAFKNFVCKSIPYHTARKTGVKCFNDGVKIEIGFDLGARFLKVLEVCHSDVREETYYAKYQLTPANEGYQRSFPRPSFLIGTFFNGKNVDALYTRVTQRETIAGLIGSFEMAAKYIEETSDIFLARGHLAAKADFIYGSQQRATFYFMNVAPQFQRFNGLNWEAVEDSSRKLAANRNIALDVYTGTFGTLSLNDYYKNPKDIYLYVNGLDRRIPIPRLYYKVLINKADGTGIVLIGVNNPHLTLDEIKKDFIICTDVSDMISYVNWEKDDISRGYSYACDVNEFLKIVPHFAEINVKSLLI